MSIGVLAWCSMICHSSRPLTNHSIIRFPLDSGSENTPTQGTLLVIRAHYIIYENPWSSFTGNRYHVFFFFFAAHVKHWWGKARMTFTPELDLYKFYWLNLQPIVLPANGPVCPYVCWTSCVYRGPLGHAVLSYHSLHYPSVHFRMTLPFCLEMYLGHDNTLLSLFKRHKNLCITKWLYYRLLAQFLASNV